MKVKFTMIPLIPAALAMVILRVMSIFGADDNGKLLGMDKMAVAYTVIGIGLALFVICIVMNLTDRKTAPVYPVRKNIAAGVLSALSGAMVMAGSVAAFMNSTPDSEYYAMTLVCAIFSIPAGIAFLLMARVHFLGKSIVSGVSMLFVFPALWGCTELVHQFLEATKVSISATDLTPLFCFIFFTLYYFSHAMVVSRIKGRNPVKGCFIYGCPAVALGVSYSIYVFFTGLREGGGYKSTLTAVMFLVLSCYALSFMAEMAKHSLTKDEVEIIDGLPTEETAAAEEKEYIKTDSYDELVFSDKPSVDADPKETQEETSGASSEYYQNTQGLDDFIIGYQAPADDEPVPYLTHAEMQKTNDNSFVAGIFDQEPAKAAKSVKPVEENTAEPEPEEVPDLVFAPAPAPAPEPEPAESPEEPDLVFDQRQPKSSRDIDDLLKELDSK